MEPHHSQQNPAERRIKTIKNYTSKIMDCPGAPSKTWFLCLVFVVFLLIHTPLNGKTVNDKSVLDTQQRQLERQNSE